MFKKTKEKINSNEYVSFTKKLWANKRYRSLLILLLYFIFFFIVITGLRSSYQEVESIEEENKLSVKETIDNQYQQLENYSYEILLNDEVVIDGLLSDGINNFTYNNQKFSIILDNVYLNKNEDLKKVELEQYNKLLIPIDSVLINNILDKIITLEPVDSNEGYSAIYEIPYSYFDIDDDGVLEVNVTGNKRIEEIIFDLTEYAEEEYKITIRIGENND